MHKCGLNDEHVIKCRIFSTIVMSLGTVFCYPNAYCTRILLEVEYVCLQWAESWNYKLATMTSTAATGQHGRSYESNQHGVTVVKGFQRLWQETLMCDTQLVVQGQSFNVHRAYLAACSQYFYSMFTKDFQEKSQNQVIGISCCYRQMWNDTLGILSVPTGDDHQSDLTVAPPLIDCTIDDVSLKQ